MDKEEAVIYILQYLNVSENQQEYVSSVIKGAWPYFKSMPELISHVKQCMELDLKKTNK